MKNVIYISIFMMLLMLNGCGAAGQIEAAEIAAATDELSEMGEVHLHIEEEPCEEYMAGLCTFGTEYSGNEEQESFPIEIKLRGNSSKEVDKKAYTIKFEDEQSLLGMEPARKWALVSNPFDKTLLRPAVGFTYAQELGIDYTPDFRLCKVWLNDDYMGVYTAMEPIEAGQGRVEIDPDNGDFLLERNIGRFEEDVVYMDSPAGLRFEFNEPEELDEEQQAQCYEMLAAAEEAIFSGDHVRYEQRIDVESFVNFYILHEMVKDVDFGEYSTRYYFRDGILYAGPPWDFDLSMGNVSAKKEEFKYAAYNNVDGAGDESGDSSRGLWAATGDYYYWLCRDPWFMELVQQRWQAVRPITENLAVDNELGTNLLDRYLAAYEKDLRGNFHGGNFAVKAAGNLSHDAVPDGHITAAAGDDNCWVINEPAHISEWQEPAADYTGNVELLRQWLIKRAAYLDGRFGMMKYVPELL